MPSRPGRPRSKGISRSANRRNPGVADGGKDRDEGTLNRDARGSP